MQEPARVPGYARIALSDARLALGRVIVLVGVKGGDAKRLQRIAEERGQTTADVVSGLL